jgi:FtsH-binding integral membrane protein
MSSLRVVLAVVLGFGAFIVGSASDDMLGAARSPSPPLSFVIMGAYLALCQFLVAKKGMTPRANWATLLGMAAPPALILFAGTFAFERQEIFLNQGVPGLLAGSLGPVLGAVAAWVWPTNA